VLLLYVGCINNLCPSWLLSPVFRCLLFIYEHCPNLEMNWSDRQDEHSFALSACAVRCKGLVVAGAMFFSSKAPCFFVTRRPCCGGCVYHRLNMGVRLCPTQARRWLRNAYYCYHRFSIDVTQAKRGVWFKWPEHYGACMVHELAISPSRSIELKRKERPASGIPASFPNLSCTMRDRWSDC